jgi:hypothetical protein
LKPSPISEDRSSSVSM